MTPLDWDRQGYEFPLPRLDERRDLPGEEWAIYPGVKLPGFNLACLAPRFEPDKGSQALQFNKRNPGFCDPEYLASPFLFKTGD